MQDDPVERILAWPTGGVSSALTGTASLRVSTGGAVMNFKLQSLGREKRSE